ncbi:MAG: VWA domain-containing protein [Myxococcales bacterium]|nr:VWA domain-containing protein [Myxococcales bacterium]
MTPRLLLAIPPLLALLHLDPAHAGPIVIPGAWGPGSTFTPTPKSTPRAVRFAEIDATADTTEARARLVYRLAPEPEPTPTTLLIPLPQGARVADTRVTLDDRPAPGWYLRPEQARAALAALGEATGDTALLAHAGRPAWLVPTATLAPAARVTVETTWPLDAIDGMTRVRIPLPSPGPDGPARLRAALTLRSTPARGPLRAVFSPTHAIEVHRPDPYTAAARLTADRGEGEWIVLAAADPAPLGLRVLTHRADDADGGWFLLLGNPTGGDGKAPIAKDVVIALDTSGSMRGEKMEQARLAAEQVIARLGPDDRFNIVAFGTDVQTLAEAPLPQTEAHRARAAAFVDALIAHGRTNIADALDAALAGDSDRPRIVLFLTDGTPTAGLRDPKAILAAMPSHTHSRVFVFGVGHDVNAHLLDQIAERTGGASTYVDPGEPIDVKVAALYDSLSHPVLADVKLDFGGLTTTAVHPDAIPQLFRGQEILIVGRYTGGGRHTLTLGGVIDGAPERHAITVDFPTAATTHDTHFVATLWATRRIGELLRKLRLDGPDEATVAEVVELSRRHGILTEYTAFLSTDERSYDGDEALGRTAELVEKARSHQSGRWAVRQSDNEQALRHRKVASGAANVYRDRQGRVQTADKLRMMDGRAFYKRGDKWVEADDGKRRATRRVKKFSPEYMKLVEENEDFARAQQLGADMIINLEDTQVELY